MSIVIKRSFGVMEPLAETHREAIRRVYNRKQAAFIEGVLDEGHLRLIDETESDLNHSYMGPLDYLHAAIAEHLVRTKPEVAEKLTKTYMKPYMRDYMVTQVGWGEKNRQLIRMNRQRNGLDCSNTEVIHEQMLDYENGLGAKFGLYYRFKFGNNKKRIKNGERVLVLRDWEAKRFSAWPKAAA